MRKRKPLTAWTLLAIVFSVLAALAASAVPLGVGAAAVPWPHLSACVVFFWLVHRPRGMPVLAVVLIGLAQDLVTGGVPGSTMIALLLASLAVRPMADALQRAPFGPRLLAFAAFAAAVLLIGWALTALPRWTAPPFGSAVARFFVTVLAYAALSVIFRRVLRIGRS